MSLLSKAKSLILFAFYVDTYYVPIIVSRLRRVFKQSLSSCFRLPVREGLLPGSDPDRAEPFRVQLVRAPPPPAARRGRSDQVGEVSGRARVPGEEGKHHTFERRHVYLKNKYFCLLI